MEKWQRQLCEFVKKGDDNDHGNLVFKGIDLIGKTTLKCGSFADEIVLVIMEKSYLLTRYVMESGINIFSSAKHCYQWSFPLYGNNCDEGCKKLLLENDRIAYRVIVCEIS